ncbi:MAG: hypothetical protein FWD70_05715 [Desulfuromonadales bacterium]|nr:hypothetical protein [Desulfuromonadales bacterium]
MAFKKILFYLVSVFIICLPESSFAAANTINNLTYSITPPELSFSPPPNVLIILDNSNSMDEDFIGNAVGSYDPSSKSVVARQTLTTLVQQYANLMNIGLMAYTLPNGSANYASNANMNYVSKNWLYKSPYFVSYNSKSYCPNITSDVQAACTDWCANGDNGTNRNTCRSGCQAGNPDFDETYGVTPGPDSDEVISARSIGDPLRTKYCGLVYPKTQELSFTNPDNSTGYAYYAGAGYAFYSYQTLANQIFVFSGLIPSMGITTDTYLPLTQMNSSNPGFIGPTYYQFTTKNVTSDPDDGTGYANPYIPPGFLNNQTWYVPSDSDLALGYGNFGRRMVEVLAGQTWSSNPILVSSALSGGYLRVPIAPNDSSLTQQNTLLAMLNPHSGDEAGYMSCEASDPTQFDPNTITAPLALANPNSCPYVINAGLTPTAGTLRDANSYFSGSYTQNGSTISSPINYPCQANFIIYVTDGMPTVDENGNPGDSATLVGTDANPATGTVLNELDKLLSGVTVNSGSYSIQTYVVGLGSTELDSNLLGLMAKHGGTQNAYTASQPQALMDALTQIFRSILAQTAAGSAPAMPPNGNGSGTTFIQTQYYPKKIFEDQTYSTWLGEMRNFWYYIDPYIVNSSIREDTDGDKTLNLFNDEILVSASNGMVQKYKDVNGNGINLVQDGAPISWDDAKSLWDAGQLLWTRNVTADPRSIWTSTGSTTLTPFTSGSAGTLYQYLNVSSAANAQTLINWVNGIDQTGLKNRTVDIKNSSTGVISTNVWKLGDLISSTPVVESVLPLNDYYLPTEAQAPSNAVAYGYGDKTYNTFTSTPSYANRGMVYIGGNDGMIHAFNTGQLSTKAVGATQAWISGSNLGREVWAFIPENALPYLQYVADPTTPHQYTVDGPLILTDASTNPSSTGSYWTQAKTDTSWRTYLIGSMGLGGATSNSCNNPSSQNCIPTPVKVTGTDIGYSSYFALDVTNPTNTSPSLKWEFTDPDLGLSTSGVSIVRVGDPSTNGRWFAVFASGPTGYVDPTTSQFYGVGGSTNGNKDMYIYVVDLNATMPFTSSGTSPNYWKIDTGIKGAFAGPMVNRTIDTESGTNNSGYYEDDAIYVGYTAPVSGGGTGTTWTSGGVLRILIPNLSKGEADGTNPANWKVSPVIQNIGPVTTSISSLMNSKTGQFWLYFGTGRYFYRTSTTLDDWAPPAPQGPTEAIYGVQDPCYSSITTPGGIVPGFKKTCTTTISQSSLVNQTNLISNVGSSSGWYVNLNPATSTTPATATINDSGAERVITDPSASANGIVTFTTFEPNMNICGTGGYSFLRPVRFDNGALPPAWAMNGVVFTTLTTGETKQISFADILAGANGSSVSKPIAIAGTASSGSGTDLGSKLAGNPLVLTFTNNKPVKKIIHIQEH